MRYNVGLIIIIIFLHKEFKSPKLYVHNWYNSCVRLCVLEQEQECLKLAEHGFDSWVLTLECIRYMLEIIKTEQS